VVVGQYAARARHQRAAAAIEQAHIRRIHRLAELAAQGAATGDVVEAAQEELSALLGLQSCRFGRAPHDRALPRLRRNGTVERPDAPGTRLRLARCGFEFPAGGVELAVSSRGRHMGRLVLDPNPGVGVSPEQGIVAVALADQVGAVLNSNAAE
jgi:hypothetical protein